MTGQITPIPGSRTMKFPMLRWKICSMKLMQANPFGQVSLRGIQAFDNILKTWHRVRHEHGPRPRGDSLGQLGTLHGQAFLGQTFVGLEDILDGPTPVANRFILSDGKHPYALAEVSSAEQAVFPILYELARQQIHHGPAIIDEIDLNRHPPLAQRRLGMLSNLWRTKQFVFTTHSRIVS